MTLEEQRELAWEEERKAEARLKHQEKYWSEIEDIEPYGYSTSHESPWVNQEPSEEMLEVQRLLEEVAEDGKCKKPLLVE